MNSNKESFNTYEYTVEGSSTAFWNSQAGKNTIYNQEIKTFQDSLEKICAAAAKDQNGQIEYYQIGYSYTGLENQTANAVYAYKVESTAEDSAGSDTLDIVRLFSDLSLSEGDDISLEVDADGKLVLSQNGIDYESESSLAELSGIGSSGLNFGLGKNVGNLKRSGFLDAEFEESEDTSEELTTESDGEESTAAETDSETATADESEDGVSDGALLAETDEIASEAAEIESEAAAEETAEELTTTTAAPTEAKTEKSGVSLPLVIGLVLACLLALAALFAAILANKKNQKLEEKNKSLEDDLKKQKENAEAEVGKSNENHNADLDNLRGKIAALEQKLKEKDAEIADLNKKAEYAKIAGADYNKLKAEFDAKDMQITGLNEEIENLKSEKTELESKIKIMAAEINKNLAAKKAAEEAAKKAAEEAAKKRPVSGPDELAKNISLSTDYADEMSEKQTPKYMIVNTNLAGEITFSESGSFRQAPFIVFGSAICLNPWYFEGLPTGEESYSKLESLSGIFDLTGLESKYSTYALEYIHPAVIEEKGGTYYLKAKGKITVK